MIVKEIRRRCRNFGIKIGVEPAWVCRFVRIGLDEYTRDSFGDEAYVVHSLSRSYEVQYNEVIIMVEYISEVHHKVVSRIKRI